MSHFLFQIVASFLSRLVSTAFDFLYLDLIPNVRLFKYATFHCLVSG